MPVTGESRHGHLVPTQVTGAGIISEFNGIHVPYQWIAENQAARLSLTSAVLTASDVGKWLFQESDATVWVLTDNSPVTWVSVGISTTNFYTKTELQTPGSSSVDWGNLVNIGSITDLSDVDTVTTPPNNNDALVYKSSFDMWVPSPMPDCTIFDNILTDGSFVLIDGSGHVMYTPC